MPYCTVEEAWGKQYNKSSKKYDRFKKINDELPDNSSELQYSNIDFGNKKNKQNKQNFSRNYNRLSEHTGPIDRLPNKEKINKERLFMSNDNNKILEEKHKPKYSNNDLPINKYDKKLDYALEYAPFDTDVFLYNVNFTLNEFKK